MLCSDEDIAELDIPVSYVHAIVQVVYSTTHLP